MLLSIIVFFVLVIGLGFLVDLIIKEWPAGFFEKLVIRIGAGVLLIPVLGVLFNHLHIPIHWVLFLLLSIVIFGIALYYRKDVLLSDFNSFKKPFLSLRIKKSHIYTFFVLIIFAISAYMYIHGSFSYPWFENGDPYSYALASKYIALEKTYDVPYHFTHFAYPYTQGYQIFMGLMHQTNNSIYWNMKFFNALIISFSVLFFFYFAKKFTKNASSAFWATLTLAVIPAWLGHFVFALNFNMALMFLLFYALFSIDENRNWKYLAAIFYGAIIISHFYTSVIITVLLLIVYLLRVLVYKDFSKDYLDVFIVGFAVGLVFWVPAIIKNWGLFENGAPVGGLEVFFPLIQKIAGSAGLTILFFIAFALLFLIYWKNQAWFKHINRFLRRKDAAFWIYLSVLVLISIILIVPSEKILYSRGSGDRAYGIADFFIAQKGNMINNPIGIGFVVMIIFLIGLAIILLNFKRIFKEENFTLLVLLTWVIFSFIGLMGVRLSIGFVPFRMWTFFGMALSLVVGYSIYTILNSFEGFGDIKPIAKSVFIILLVVLVYYTSFAPKYWHNTAVWPEHQIMVPESQELFIWMGEGGLPKDSLVLPLCNYPALVVGYDMLSKPWEDESLRDKDYLPGGPERFYLISLSQSLEENYDFLKKHGYDYTILGAECIAKLKSNQTLLLNRINEMVNSTKFSLVKSTESEFLFKVN